MCTSREEVEAMSLAEAVSEGDDRRRWGRVAIRVSVGRSKKSEIYEEERAEKREKEMKYLGKRGTQVLFIFFRHVFTSKSLRGTYATKQSKVPFDSFCLGKCCLVKCCLGKFSDWERNHVV